jgi:thiol-disulfide isomerase/thioredoxin
MLSRVAACLLLAYFFNVAGCSTKTASDEESPRSSAKMQAAAAESVTAEDLLVSPSDPNEMENSASGSKRIDPPIPAPERPSLQVRELNSRLPNATNGEIAKSGKADDPTFSSEPRKLRPDLSPEALVEFLAGADEDMQRIYSGAAGIRDNNLALARMREIGKLKLEAAKRLRDHSDATQEQKVEASRGVLQSLSHLAALGDLASATELEALANKNLQSSDPRIVTDSQLVLIGFAIESLRNGKEEAPEKIMELVGGLSQSSTKPDVPTMMVLGQARQLLAQYGHHEQAGMVRETIIDLFADTDDPQIASMAAQLAGSVEFDAIDRMLETAIGGGEVSAEAWSDAAKTLIDESADIMTVQFLAGAALEFEAINRDDLADATYDLLYDRFGEQSDAMGEETRIAIDARNARRQVVGLVFDPALNQIDGTPLNMSQFSGKVVLMPFWASGFPQSLQLLPLLTEIRDSQPDKIAIVGMNLDPKDSPTQEFVRQNGLDFPSYHSVSSPTGKVSNSVATRFGMVSMPFVVVLDQQGRVVSLDFKGQKLRQIVDALLSQ